MRLFLVCIVLLSASTAHAGDCLSTDQLAQLENQEMAYMLGRIPPAFRHSLEDKKISMHLRTEGSSADGKCRVKETLTLPSEEITEAEQVLEQDPAKRILLFSQGYSLPSATTLEAGFSVDASKLEIAHQDTLQVAELGKLRASVEMMYAMLSQSRAGIQAASQAIQPWSTEFTLKTRQSCQTHFRSLTSVEQACECRSKELEALYPARTLDYLEYVLSNPYAKATGAAENFAKQQDLIHARCGLQKP